MSYPNTRTRAAPTASPAKVAATSRALRSRNRSGPPATVPDSVGNQALHRWATMNPLPGAPPIGSHDHPDEQQADRLADAALERRAHRPGTQPLSTPSVEGRTLQALGPGSPLPDNVRQSMQRGFATDLSPVRVHTGPQASRMSGALGARAFAIGSHVAFGSRQFAPESRAGSRLLAHELAHVVAQPELRVRAERVADPLLENSPGTELRTAVLNAYRNAIDAGERSEFREHFLEEITRFGDQWYPGDQSVALRRRAGEVVDISLGTVREQVQDAFTLLRGLQALDHQSGDDELAVLGFGSLGLSLAMSMLSDDAALQIWQEINSAIVNPPQVELSLENIRRATTNADARYSLEIEATLLALLDARQTWNQALPGARTGPGEQIAMLSRRLLLLDMALKAVRAIPPDQSAALERALIDAGSRIATLRTASANEASALVALGDDPSLLAPQQLQEVDVSSGAGARYYQELEEARTVEPDTAFPATVDINTAQMVSSMASSVTSAEQDARRLREGVIPPVPTYTLVEFMDVYRRWYAFFSPQEEQQHPLFRLIMGFFSREAGLDPNLQGEERKTALERSRSPYELLGISMRGRIYDTASFSAARFFALSYFAPMLSGAMGSASDQFAGEVGALGTTRQPLEPWGTASSAHLSPALASRLPDGRTVRDPQQAASDWSAQTAQRFSEVARMPATGPSATRINLQRLYGPTRARTIADPDAPIIGVHDVTARDGWSYLIETRDPTDPDAPVIAREHRVVPPEVVRYLTAANAARAMSAGPMQPTARRPDGRSVPIGDRPTRAGGLTQARARASEDLLGRDALPTSDRARFERDRRALADAVATPRPSPLGQLLVDMERYLDAYFVTRSTIEWRLAAVLAIASAEHNLGAQVEQAMSAEHIGEVAWFTMKVQVVKRLLDARGPLGRILSRGIDRWLQVSGTGELASIVGIATYLYEIAKVTSFRQARAWAYITPTIFGDLSNLFDAVITRGVGAATGRVLDRIANGPPPTPRNMAALANEIGREPAARQRMLDAVDAELSELGRAGRHGSEEYRAMEAFRHEIVQAGERAPIAALSPEAARALDLPAPGLADEAAAVRDIDFARPRPEAEAQALRDAIPAELRGRVRIVEDPLLSVDVPAGQRVGVRVVPGDREVLIRVGRDVTPDMIAAHIPAARDSARFTGVGGRLRTLLVRLQMRLGILPDPATLVGTRAFEAQREVEKLSRMILELRERQSWLEQQEAAAGRGATLSDTQRAEIDLQIASLERQLAYHARDLGSFEAGRGYIAASDRQTSIRQTVEAALEAGGMPRAQAAARAQQFVRDARSQQRLDAVEDLANSGLLSRLVSSGAPPDVILRQLGAQGGYAALVRADVDPATAGALFGDPRIGQRMQERRTALATTTASAAASSVASQWPVDPATGDFDPQRLPAGWTERSIEQAARQRTPPEGVPRQGVVFRRWRYVQSRRNPLSLREWAPLGYQANLNRDVSSPHERLAMRARDAYPNNEPETSGGRQEYDYEEWTRDGDFVASRRDRAGRRRGETLRYETTRPDGIRPREDGGFDVVEHKHMTRGEAVLNDSIQFRAQREMARAVGRGRHEIVITTDLPPLPDGTPAVRLSEPLRLAEGTDIFFVDIATGRVTHRWDKTQDRWGNP